LSLPANLLAKLQQLRSIPDHLISVADRRLREDLEHRLGVSGIEDAIRAGGADPGDREAGSESRLPHCPKCKSLRIQGRSTPTGIKWHCLEQDCGVQWSSSCGPTLFGARTGTPAPNPSVHRTRNDYYPSGGAKYRHPLMNHEPEE